MIMFWIACFIVISFVFLVFVEQTCTKNSIELHEDPNEQLVDELAAELGLRRVGWIFTDLVALDLTKGTVKHTRGNLVRTILFIVAMALLAVCLTEKMLILYLILLSSWGCRLFEVVIS